MPTIYIQALRIAFGFCLFSLTGSCYLAPILIAKYWRSRTLTITSPNRAYLNRRWGSRCISLSNCVAAGIFLALCFLGLFPYTASKFKSILEMYNYKTVFPIAECVIVSGFLMAMLLEQTLLSLKEYRDSVCHEDREQVRGLLECEMQDLSDDPSGVLHDDHTERLVKDTVFREDIQNEEMSEASNGNENGPTVSKFMEAEQCNHVSLLVQKENGHTFFMLAFVSAIHSVFEGMTLGLQTDVPKAVHLFIAIIIHQCLISGALGVNSMRMRYSFFTHLKFTFGYSSAVPFGLIVGILTQKAPGAAGELASAILQGLTAGVLLHVVFQDFFPSEFANNQDRFLKVFCIFIGFLVIAFVTYVVNVY